VSSSDLKDSLFKPSDIFQELNTPDCFSCDACMGFKNCNMPCILLIWKRMKKKMEPYLFDQINSLLFEYGFK
jgi:hypothetical protein